MTPSGHTQPASFLSWESFALTNSRWLVHALLWSLGLLSATITLPWFFTGYSILFGLALLAAVVTAYTGPRESTSLPPLTLGRYILVDSIFVSFATHPVFFLLQIVLTTVGLSPYASGPHYGLPLSLYFVGGFYLCLGIIGHARLSTSQLRMMPPIAAAATAALLIVTGYPQFTAYRTAQQSRDVGVASYERETGQATTDLAKLRIGNSLHGFDGRVSTITIDQHDRLLVSGGFEYYAGKDARSLIRLLPDGQKDTTFSPLHVGDPTVSGPSRVLVSSDESIVINTTVDGSRGAPMGLTRLHPDGTVDPQFRLDMSRDSTDRVRLESMDLQPDDRLVIVSPSRFLQKSEDSCLLRFDSTGIRDDAFSTTVMTTLYGPASSRPQSLTCSISKVTALATGDLLVEGSFPVTETQWKHTIVRLNPDGSLDAAYRPELDNLDVSLSIVMPSGELFAVYYVAVPSLSPKTYQAHCVKLKADGRRDPSFNLQAGRFLRIDQLAVQPDGKVVITGTLSEKDYGAIVRLLSDGQPDPTFAGPAGIMHVDGFITTIGIQQDGHIVLGGEFQQVIGPSKGQRVDRQNIARLFPDGTLDTAFDPR